MFIHQTSLPNISKLSLVLLDGSKIGDNLVPSWLDFYDKYNNDSKIFIVLTVVLLWVFIQTQALKANVLALGTKALAEILSMLNG